jgi:oxygen-independent coproporphyrinogen-3 oxidase
MDRYHKALVAEITSFYRNKSEKYRIKTIFFGGGTPSTYPDTLLLDMFAILKENFIIDKEHEITIEVNPGTVRPEQIELWKKVGINRLSIGVQSLNDNVLKDLNRHQRAQDVRDLIERAKDEIPNLSLDLIIGLPGIPEAEWKSLIMTVVRLPIKHLSVYFLTVHEGTALYFRVKRQEVQLPADDGLVDLYTWTVATLHEHGFNQYEISNFSMPGFESRHNYTYWIRKPYQGFGVGACSFDGASRFQNTKNLFAYCDALEKGESIVDFVEYLSEDQIFLETVMLGLRQCAGLNREKIISQLAEPKKEAACQMLKQLCDEGYLKENNKQVVLTPRGLAVEQEIVVRLLS